MRPVTVTRGTARREQLSHDDAVVDVGLPARHGRYLGPRERS